MPTIPEHPEPPTIEDELEQTKTRLAEAEIRLVESEYLIGYLRDRTAALNAEVRHRDRLVGDRDGAIIALSDQLEGSS